MDLCLRKTGPGKSRGYHDVIGFEKLRFQNVFYAHQNTKSTFSNSSCLKIAFEIQLLRFRDGLVRTVGLTVEIKMRFEICPA